MKVEMRLIVCTGERETLREFGPRGPSLGVPGFGPRSPNLGGSGPGPLLFQRIFFGNKDPDPRRADF